MKVLVAEDDVLSRVLLERILQRAGYEVKSVDKWPQGPGGTGQGGSAAACAVGLGHARKRWRAGVP